MPCYTYERCAASSLYKNVALRLRRHPRSIRNCANWFSSAAATHEVQLNMKRTILSTTVDVCCSVQVLVTSLSLQQVEFSEPANFWVGPRAVSHTIQQLTHPVFYRLQSVVLMYYLKNMLLLFIAYKDVA